MNAKNHSAHEVIEIAELSEQIETEGFDLQAGTTWVYPTNYPCRDYQYAIIQEALLKNTMVSLPTGLGKTFIAAVVMYNFYRWYPRGKVIFMAPTKPLVKQQIDACYNIMAIPKETTAEVTGTKVQEFRKDIWNEKRVFFITPQVLQNDLNILQNFGNKIKCLVVDEAHKAKGNYAYCEVIRKLTVQNKYFRVLALSATPGNSIKDVAEVINNLQISHLEIRTDDSPDVLPYVFERSLETVVIPLGDMLQKVRDDYMQVLERYTKVLMQNKILYGNCSTLTKGKIFMTMKLYQEQNRQNRDRNYSDNMRYLNTCHTLYYAFELLLRHGLRSFLLFFQDRIEKTMLHENVLLKNIIRNIEEYMGPLLNIESLPDGSITGIPDTVKFGHPKFYKLREVTCEHFQQQNTNETRVIIFCEYRETVMEAYGILSLSQPLVRPRIFMGQSSITQKQQINVIKSFRDGTCNTLISTCIGEEGLDVGNVDLIICFDINNKSPIRMIQRMGRTGRKREGRVVIFVTEGREQQTLKECLIQKQNLNNHILQQRSFVNEMYADNPRMVPPHIEPKCNKIFITVKSESSKRPSKFKSKNIKDVFKLIAEGKKHNTDTNEAKLIDIVDITDKLPDAEYFWNSGKGGLFTKGNVHTLTFGDKLHKVKTLQPIGFINHSNKTKMLVSLLEKCDSLKFNLPLTQTPILISQKPSNKPKVVSVNNFKQQDIRNMFKQPSHSGVDFAKADLEVIVIDETSDQNQNPFTEEYNTALPIESNDYINNCKLCSELFDCTQYYSTLNLNFNINEWREPDTSIYNTINYESLILFEKVLNECDDKILKVDSVDSHLNVTINDEKQCDIQNSENEEDLMHLVNSPFKLPKTINNVLRKCNLLDLTMPNVPITQLESLQSKKMENLDCTVNLQGFNDVEFTQLQDIKAVETKTHEHDLSDGLDFFNISALEDIFDDSHNKAQFMNVSQGSDSTIIYTPQTTAQVDCNKGISILPILNQSCSQIDNKMDEQNRKSTSSTNFDDVVDTSLDSPVLLGRSKTCTKPKLIDENEHCHHESYSNLLLNKGANISASIADTNTKHDLDEFFNKSIMDMFYNVTFEESSKKSVEIESKGLLQNEREEGSSFTNVINSGKTENSAPNEKCVHTSKFNGHISPVIARSASSTKIVNTEDWQSNIWNFCMDSDVSMDDEVSCSKITDAIICEAKQNTPNTPNKVIEIVSDQSDDFISSPSKSPSLIMSQRISNRSQLHSKEQGTATLSSSQYKVTWTPVSSTRGGCDVPINLNESADSLHKHTSPVLNKTQKFIHNKLKVPKKLIFSDDDDDDFQLEPKQTSSWIFPRNRNVQSSKGSNAKNSYRSVEKHQTKKDVQDCPYVILEADVSRNYSDSSDFDQDESFDKSFVDDETQDIANTTMMHVKYLQSVRSVDGNKGNFKIPRLPVNNINVYSQVDVMNEENTYLNDTFCVSSQEDLCHNTEEMSELELAELLLEKKRKGKKSKSQSKPVKRIRIIVSSSDSD